MEKKEERKKDQRGGKAAWLLLPPSLSFFEAPKYYVGDPWQKGTRVLTGGSSVVAQTYAAAPVVLRR